MSSSRYYNLRLQHPHAGTPPVAQGRDYVNPDLTFPRNFQEFCRNCWSRKRDDELDLAARQESRAQGEDPAGSIFAHLAKGHRVSAEGYTKLIAWVCEGQSLPPDQVWNLHHTWMRDVADGYLQSAKENFAWTVAQTHEIWPFLVPVSALTEACGPEFAAEALATREVLKGAHPELAEINRYC